MCKRNKKKTIQDLKTIKDLKAFDSESMSKAPSEYKILVIDDEKFTSATLLKNTHHYSSIDYIAEFDDIDRCSGYDLILVDINNVAKNFDGKEQGYAAAKLIKQKYKNIDVCLYTGMSLDESSKREKEQEGFRIIRKPISPKELGSIFDEIRKKQRDPSVIWSKTEKLLLENNAYSHKDLAIMEDTFVRNWELNKFEAENVETIKSSIKSGLLNFLQELAINFFTNCLLQAMGK